MLNENNNWFYYKKILSWIVYALLALFGTYIVYFIVEYFFVETFESRGEQYISYQSTYTSEPGSDPGLVDKKKWEKQSVDKGWNISTFYTGFVHPLVAVTIASIIIVAIIGGIVVFRHQMKHPYR
ncbi:hypothetical protein JEZ13_01135 [bacterium]|nr:hypothetical protein [bacterium]